MRVKCYACGRYFQAAKEEIAHRMIDHHIRTEHEGAERALAKRMQPLGAFR